MSFKTKNANFTGKIRKREKCKGSKNVSLRTRMLSQLAGARFRYMNEVLYKSESNSTQILSDQSTNFEAYHEGFRQQLKQWPINPLDFIIKSLKKRNDLSELTIVDLGCGEAHLNTEISPLARKVISYDLKAVNPAVKECDVRNTPLPSGKVDVVVYCLSLMASNLTDHFKEANRILKIDGLMMIAEVESRFENVDNFIRELGQFGFKLEKKNFSHNLFYFMDFKKSCDIIKFLFMEEIPIVETSKAGADSTNESPKQSRNKLLSLPLSRVKQIIKMDPDVNLASSEAVFLIAKSAEIFIGALSKEAYAFTANAKKKTVQKKDIDSAIENIDQFCFLEGAIDV